jgi:RimJ/RimL family protein N-acetyltransferase
MDDTTRAWFEPPTLVGETVRLEPLRFDHLAGLTAAARDPRIWTWMPADGSTDDGIRAIVDAALAAQAARSMVTFVTIEQADGRVVGSSRYMNLVPTDLRLEIGWTWIDPAFQRTAVNTEAKLAMLGQAFDALGCRRVELKTDALNGQSRTAILGIGATYEGIFRKHMVMAGGRARDTAYYSILDDEWPTVRDRLQERLARDRGAR